MSSSEKASTTPSGVDGDDGSGPVGEKTQAPVSRFGVILDRLSDLRAPTMPMNKRSILVGATFFVAVHSYLHSMTAAPGSGSNQFATDDIQTGAESQDHVMPTNPTALTSMNSQTDTGQGDSFGCARVDGLPWLGMVCPTDALSGLSATGAFFGDTDTSGGLAETYRAQIEEASDSMEASAVEVSFEVLDDFGNEESKVGKEGEEEVLD